MAEILSPGVFIEEVPSQVQVIQAVSTSNLGTVGYTDRGPENTPTLVTSFEQFTRVFGPIISDSVLPLSMAAYFANGGTRAFIVRVVPADAVAADAKVDSLQTDQEIGLGDGIATTFSATSGTTTLVVNDGASPIVPGSFTVSWREDGTPVVAENLRNIGDTADVTVADTTQAYEFRINPSSLPTYDLARNSVVDASVTLNWDPDGSTPTTLAIPAPTQPNTIAVAVSGAGTRVIFDYRTGIGAVEFAGAEVIVAGGNGGNLTADFTPATETLSVTDDGAGVLPAGTELSGAGSVDYTTGAYSFDSNNPPHEGASVQADYSINAWDLDPTSKGTWANNLRLQIQGDLDYFTAATGTYSRYVVNVLLLNSSTGNFDIVETYDGLSLTDATDAQYFADVLNELSDYINVAEPAGDEAPNELNGIFRSEFVGGGAEAVGTRTVTATLTGAPVQPRSVSIQVADTTGTAREVTDDGSGNLVGWVDASGNNTINYTTGAIDVTLAGGVNGGTLIGVEYYEAPSESSRTESFSGGTNGTFDSTNYGRSQFTAPTLEASKLGMFALNDVEELMQVTIPDFVGDATISQDMVDYADGRSAQNSGGDRFVILQPPAGSNAQEAIDWLQFDLQRNSRFSAIYWPHVRVADPLANNRPKTITAVNHIAGIYARTDATKNVGKAPGGTIDGALRFLTGLELDPSQGDRDTVYPRRINPLINTPQTGLAVWGVRTASLQSEWRYINVRRLFMFVEKSVYNSTQWIVFENNGPALWARIQAQLNGFLINLYNDGLLAGNAPSEAFFVTVDESNNDTASIEAGRVNIDVGLAANKPAEFVIFRFTQTTA